MCLLFIFILLWPTAASSNVAGGLTKDFQNWLNEHGYDSDDFVRADYGTQGSFGGKTATAPNVTTTPVVFFHGNSDTALQTNSFSTGWDNSILYFLQNGYTTADLYATSWGNNKETQAGTRTHSCYEVLRLRRFVEAVLAYTGAKKVSIIGHSMGVTLARKVVKGGKIEASDGSCTLGYAIANKVDVFIGLAGANYGMCNCEGSGALMEASCNKKNGFWPGDSCGMNSLTCGLHPLPWPCNNGPNYSKYLMELNQDPTAEGDYVFSTWSTADDVIMYNDKTWGHPTSFIPTSTDKKTYSGYTHMQTKEKTAPDQYIMITEKKVPYA